MMESISDKIRVMRAQEASSKEKHQKGNVTLAGVPNDQCFVTQEINPNHICVKSPEKGNEDREGEEQGEEEEDEEEPEGPSYIVIKKEDARVGKGKEEKGKAYEVVV